MGSVVSALADESRRFNVPYHDSNLTQLLQDSLGGNSYTLVLACISPAAADYMKTCNTLEYASRARSIQNVVLVNSEFEDSAEKLSCLRTRIAQLEMQVSILSNQHNAHSFALLRKQNQEILAELAQVQSERDTLAAAAAQSSADRVEAHPVIQQYCETVRDLKLQLAEAQTQLAYYEVSPFPSGYASASLPCLRAHSHSRHDSRPSHSMYHRRQQKRKYVPLVRKKLFSSARRRVDPSPPWIPPPPEDETVRNRVIGVTYIVIFCS